MKTASKDLKLSKISVMKFLRDNDLALSPVCSFEIMEF